MTPIRPAGKLPPMDRFARIVLGYHGCLEEHALKLLTGERSIEDWEPSRNQ